MEGQDGEGKGKQAGGAAGEGQENLLKIALEQNGFRSEASTLPTTNTFWAQPFC